jgi:oxygen-independent coproporphyrinogen III oxidase
MLNLHNMTSHPLFEQRSSDYIRWYPKSLTPFGPTQTLRPESLLQGIYIHVPFCDQLCLFCPFNKRQSQAELVNQFVDALCHEIQLYRPHVHQSALQFIYFGGGSPSVLSPQQFHRIISGLSQAFTFTPGLEISVEAHPSHLNREYLAALKETGVNRISSGIQGFDDEFLKRIGAQHSAAQAFSAIEATTATFGTMAIDLLFRCEGQTLPHWESQLTQALQLPGVNHISCYSMIAEPMDKLPDVMMEAEMTLLAHELTQQAGMVHYASCASGGFDFCPPGQECRYEAQHWGAPQASFLGLGPGAFGFMGGQTTVNCLDVNHYIKSLAAGRLPLASVTAATPEEAQRRYFVLGVKTLNVPLAPFEQLFGQPAHTVFEREFQQLASLELARHTPESLTLTPLGRLYVDTVSSIFFSPQERNVPHPEEPEIRRAELETRQLV